MSNVEFNPGGDGGFDLRNGARGGNFSGGALLKLTMKLTGIQDETKANQVLLAVAIICFIATGLVLWFSF